MLRFASGSFEIRRLLCSVSSPCLLVSTLVGCGQSDLAASGPDAGGAAPSGVSPLAPPPSDLCALVLTCERAIQDEPKTDCALSIRIGAQVAYEGAAGVEKRGRSSLAYPKANYGVELRQSDGTNLPADLFGFGADEDWIFDGSWVDRSFVRNALVSDLFQAFSAGWYAPQSGFCTLQLNGEPQGLYRLVERVKQGDARVPLTKDDGTGSSFVIQQDDSGTLRFDLGLESRWESVYPKDPSPAQSNGMQSWLDRLDRALNARSDGADGVFGVLDQDNVVDWILLQEFSKNIDAYKLSVFLTKDTTGLGQLVPWDFDLSFGQPSVQDGSLALRASDEPTGWIAERTDFVRDLVAVPSFPTALTARWRALRGGPLANAAVERQLQAYERVVGPAAPQNFEIWPLDEVRFEQIYGPYHLYEVASYDAEMSHVRNWIARRLTWIDQNIDAYADGP